MYLRQLEPAEVSLENRRAGERPSQVNFHRPTRCFSQSAPWTMWTPELEDQATSGLRGKGRGGAGRACNAHRGRVPEAAHPARPSLGRTVAIRSPGRREGSRRWRTEHASSLTFTTAVPRLPCRPLSTPAPGLFTARAAILEGAAPQQQQSL